MATILVVDDLSANRQFLVTLLSAQGHRLLEASNGSEGLGIVQAEHPDLVISDVLMPVMNGYEFVQRLRLDHTTRGIPVLLYTASHGEREARTFALSSGSSWVLAKPARSQDVLNIVSRVLSGESEIGLTQGEDDEGLGRALSGQIGHIEESARASAQKRADELEHEILERKRAESALRQERDRAHRYLNTAEVILLALDLQGRVGLVNRYACAVLGWTTDELLGRDWIETCIPARTRDAARKDFHSLVGGDLSVVMSPILTRSGEERIIEWRNTVLRDEAGNVTGTFSSGSDITDRNQAIEALRTAEERMRFALEAARVGIWDMDYMTGELEWSEILESQYGLQPGTFDGTFEAFVNRIHPDDRNLVRETIGNAMVSGADFSIEHRALWPDGTVRWLSGAGRIRLGDNGEPVRGVGISMDVTERSTLEAQYRQAQKMEAIGRLAGGVAHDFNNLLTAILGHCEMLLADLDPADARRSNISKIQKAGKSAADLTRQLLAFSRKEIIQPKLFDLNVVVADMRAMLGRLIRENVKVVLAPRSGIAPVKADRGQLEQIILNLAVNAQDAMPGGGTLTIETASVELDEKYAKKHLAVKPGPHVVLTVTDTGSGMSADVQTHLFEPFFTTKDLGKGTGLGLATVHAIVGRSGGSIDVESAVGSGTSFKVYFPRADDGKIAIEAPPPVSRPRPRSQTVLVVEDAEGVRDLTRSLLQRLGYTVLVAANADEALWISQNVSLDVLLTDVVMLGGNGPELARRLAERLPALKVIYMSGYGDEAFAQLGVLDPEIVFLQKPFTSEALERKVREVLDR